MADGQEGAQGGQQEGQAGGQQQQQQGAAFDPAALQQTIQDSIKAGFETMRSEEPRHSHQQQQMQQPQWGQQAEVDPVTRVIAPIVGPALQSLNLQTQAAMDLASFYATNPDAVKHKDKIEAKFAETMQTGRPVPRQDILNWMRGGPMFKEMVEEEISRRAAATREAELAATAGGGRPAITPGKNPHDMTDDELSNALKNVAF